MKRSFYLQNFRRLMCLVRLKKLPVFMKIAFFMLFFSLGMSVAGKTITGTVTDEKGEPMIGVSVIEVGTSNGTATNADGHYTIQVAETGSLRFLYLGYVTQEQRFDSRIVINVVMVEESQKLDEVVVVGYGTQRKSDVTGSISVATGDDVLARPSFNALEGLKGKAAGVNIFVNTGNPLGVDESGPRVIIRGINSINTSTDPLYVVDGVQTNEIQYINPNTIERVEVLKDASATAIYGARGANGVILITTKRGEEGAGVTVSYDGWVKVRTLAKEVPLLNAAEFMQVEETGFANIGKYIGDNPVNIGLKPNRTDPLIFDSKGNPLYDTDWQKEATRTSISQNHQLSIRQKNKMSSVGAFFNYSDEEGIMLNNYAKRLNAKMVYDANAQKWLSINMNLEINHMWGNGIDDSGGGQTARRTIWEMSPILPVKFPDGTWSSSQFTGSKLNYGLEAMANPVQELTTRKRNRYRTKILGNLALIFHLAQGLDLRTQAGVDANVRSNKDYSPNDLINISSPNGSAGMYKGERIFWQENTYLSYNRLFNDIHRINATLGLEWSQYTEWSSNTGTVTGFTTNFFGYDNLGAGTTPSAPSSSWTQWAMNSYFGRVSYGLKDRYLLTATLRIDGSSRFGANNKYGAFPSAGLGWILTNEPFMKDKVSWLDNLKIHTSYGRTGNSEIDPYTTLATISSGTVLLNGTRAPSSQISRMPNQNLKWEKTDQFDIGINLNTFKNRLNVDLDYYYKKTSDLLLNRPLPFSTGFSSVMDNIGRVDNQGIDLLINTVNVASRAFRWESTFNLNYNKNVIKKLGENNEDILTDPSFVGGNVILRVGEPLGSFYGYKRLGTWGTNEAAEAAKVGAVPGEAKRSADREIIGNGLPDFTGSFINTFYYKNLDLIVDLQFVYGVDCWQLFTHSTEDRTGIANSLKTALSDAWTPDHQNTMVQQIRQQNYSGQNSNADSHWVANGSYLRGNLIQLGYTVDKKLLSKWNLKKLRLNLSVNNAFLINAKDFKGYDPEAASSTARFGQNIFFFEYPRSRDFSLGLNISF